MSNDNKIEKTFSRKNNEPNKSQEKQPKQKQKQKQKQSSSKSHQTQILDPPTTIIYALMSPEKQDNSIKIKKKKKKIKVKDENTEIKKEKDETPEIKKGKDETLKIIIKRKSSGEEIKIKDLKKFKKEENNNCECSFPISRVLRIIKSEGSQYKLSGEAVFLINKATEKFVELFTRNAYDTAVEEKKSFVAYKHLASVVSKEKRMDFLSDFVPEKVTAEKALAEIKPAETLPG